jgi:hypothetical protein
MAVRWDNTGHTEGTNQGRTVGGGVNAVQGTQIVSYGDADRAVR